MVTSKMSLWMWYLHNSLKEHIQMSNVWKSKKKKQQPLSAFKVELKLDFVDENIRVQRS